MENFAEELSLFRENIRRFISSEITPYYAQWQKDEIFPRELWHKLGDQGLLAVDIPIAYGGLETNYLFSLAIVEELRRANYLAVATSIVVHSDIVAHYILNNGTEEQKQRYLPDMVSGKCVGAVAMTEPAAGSDLQGIRATARRDGDDFIINGSKTFITNGQLSDLIIVVAKTNTDVKGSKGTSLFLVDADTSGFHRGRNLEKIGLHASDTSELFFDDMRVPASALLGDQDRGFAMLMGELQRERLSLAVSSVASAQGMLDETIGYVKERKAFGGTIADFQHTRFKLAETATKIRLHQSFIEECKTLFLKKELDVATVSMAKYSAAEMQSDVMDTCLQMHGGYGYMSEYGVARAFVDSRIQRIYGGASEVMQELISRDLLK